MHCHRWPRVLYLVRHGESAGNIAAETAERSGALEIHIEGRDANVPLSPRGHEQARAVAHWFAELPLDDQPTLVLSSPYRRALQTAREISSDERIDCLQAPIEIDERLREREFGVLDRLTRAGIVARMPLEVERRRAIGKLYYRAPGGESWCDVILRLRSLVHHIQLNHADERVLIVTHQVLVFCLRYLLEGLDEDKLMAIDAEGDIANCGITSYRVNTTEPKPPMKLERFNFVAAVAAVAGVTSEPDRPAGAR